MHANETVSIFRREITEFVKKGYKVHSNVLKNKDNTPDSKCKKTKCVCVGMNEWMHNVLLTNQLSLVSRAIQLTLEKALKFVLFAAEMMWMHFPLLQSNNNSSE